MSDGLEHERGEDANVLVEVNTTVGKLPELSSLLKLCSATSPVSDFVLSLLCCPFDIDSFFHHRISSPHIIFFYSNFHRISFYHASFVVKGRERFSVVTYRQLPRRSVKGSTISLALIYHSSQTKTHVFGVSHFCGFFL